MIPRYNHEEISKIWDDTNKFKTFLRVELALLKALEQYKRIPQGIAQTIEQQAKIKPQRVHEIEAKVHHDVIAFCTSITEQFPTQIGKYFHFGVTSSDILDTGLNLQIKESLEMILPEFEKLLVALKKAIQTGGDLLTLGRSHGMYAEPMIFAHKWLNFYAECSRRYRDLKVFVKTELTAQFSGAVGNYTVLNPDIEQMAADILGLPVEPVTSQVIARDHIAKLVSITSLLGSAMERIAVEIRHLQHSDVSEVAEGFAKGQKGSSTMPHKKNPVSSENITGMARILKSHYQIALENNVLWHERDISHSGAERMFLPDTFGVLFYSLKRLTSTIENLVYHREKIEAKVTSNDTYLSSFYLHHLIENSDYAREDLYEIVQAAAFASSQDQGPTFYQHLNSHLQNKGISIKLPKMDFTKLKDHYRQRFELQLRRVDKEYRDNGINLI